MRISLEQLVELAKESEITDPIDWGMLSISEDDAYRLMGSHILEIIEKDDSHFIMSAIATKLLVENFVLNLKLERMIGTQLYGK